jgi:oligoendopeptidase F
VPAVATLYADLEARSLPDRAALEAWIQDWEALGAVTDDWFNSAYVAMSCDTQDAAAEAHYLRLVEEMLPVQERSEFALQRKLLATPAVGDLDAEYAIFLRTVRTRVELFRDENVALSTEESKLAQEYDKIIGAQMVEFRGTPHTMQQMGVYLEENDRATREDAWRAREARRAADEAALDILYDRMLEIRRQIAKNAGKADSREYVFAMKLRFDDTPEDCLAFHAAIERHVVPVISRFNARRREQLGLESLRPWEFAINGTCTQIDPERRPPLRPFEDVARLSAGCRTIFHQVDGELGSFYDRMMEQGVLDLASRPGKAPGGYMTRLPLRRLPFIFMNAVGLKRDVDTLLHEGGHAFHYFLAQHQPLHAYHRTTHEFSEVASQAMEFLARPYIGEFYAPEDQARLRDDQLQQALGFLPFMAMIDAFQHWVYTTDDASATARHAKWAELEARFRPDIDWQGLEAARDAGWQYPHVFTSPFYYVEYGISLLAALRVWLNSLEDAPGAVAAYKAALALGGSRPLPDLFAAAGAEFGLDDRIVRDIVARTVAQISD